MSPLLAQGGKSRHRNDFDSKRRYKRRAGRIAAATALDKVDGGSRCRRVNPKETLPRRRSCEAAMLLALHPRSDILVSSAKMGGSRVRRREFIIERRLIAWDQQE